MNMQQISITDASGPNDPRLNDQCSQMVKTTSFNPFKITLDYRANQNLQFGNLVSIFRQEMEDLIIKANHSHVMKDAILNGYCFNMLESYFQHGGYIPKLMMDEIISQVYQAIRLTSFREFFPSNMLEQFRYNMYFCLTHK